MDTNTLDSVETSELQLDTFRQSPDQQSVVNLEKLNGSAGGRSLPGIKSLKSKSAAVCYQSNALDSELFDSIWDWFQRALGNR